MAFKTLRDIFDHAAVFAAECFKDKGELHPMWIAQCEDGSILPIAAPMDDKDKVALAVRTIFKKYKVVRHVSMLESWMLTADKDKGMPESLKHGASIASHPKRVEVIWLLAESKKGESISGYLPIMRPEHGKPTVGALKVLSENTNNEGRFANLLS